MEQDRCQVPVDDWNAVLRTPAVAFGVAVDELLADRVPLVELVQTDPSDDCVPDDRVDPCVLERRPHEPRRVPAELLQNRIDQHDAEAETAVNQGPHVGGMQLPDCFTDVLRSLCNRLFGRRCGCPRRGRRHGMT